MNNNVEIILCSIIKNSNKYLQLYFDIIYNLKKMFTNLKVVVYENDSADDTLHSLQKFSFANDYFKLLYEKNVNFDKNFVNGIIKNYKSKKVLYKKSKKDLIERTKRLINIVYARNYVLNYVQENLNPEYLIWLDVDEILINFKVDSILDVFNYKELNWSMMGGNSKIYYDYWALRDKYYKLDFWNDIDLNDNTRLKNLCFKIASFSSLIEVDSCFNGIGIYKYKYLKDLKYEYTCECEHIGLHKQMKKKYNSRFFINPKIILGPHKICGNNMDLINISNYLYCTPLKKIYTNKLYLDNMNKLYNIKIGHVINPFNCKENNPSYLYHAQPITFESMKRSRNKALENEINVELFSVNYPEDDEIVPDYFTKLPYLKKSTKSEFNNLGNKKLPIIQEIFDSILKNSDCDYIIFTNSDIGIQENFYLKVVDIILKYKIDCFTITRRDIPKVLNKKVLSINDLNLIYNIKGVNHPGSDCFIIKKDILKKLNLGKMFLAYAGWGIALTFLLNKITNFKKFNDLFLTFHLGKDRPWQGKSLYREKNVKLKQNIFAHPFKYIKVD
jgi:hypothetical protein